MQAYLVFSLPVETFQGGFRIRNQSYYYLAIFCFTDFFQQDQIAAADVVLNHGIATDLQRERVWISDKILWHVVDERVIDGTVNGVATVSRETGDRLRHANTGNIRSYATWIVLGVVVFTSLLLWMVD